jgi:hypothetical protein
MAGIPFDQQLAKTKARFASARRARSAWHDVREDRRDRKQGVDPLPLSQFDAKLRSDLAKIKEATRVRN